jgi:hypothetical protein
MSRTATFSSEIECIYICQSPVLNGCKIGYHKGSPYALHKRYQTPFTNNVFFFIFDSKNPEEHEKIVHRILKPYNISNEIFIKKEELILMYCYMAKMVTGCERLKCYSREKYGFPRSKGKWNYLKKEMEEENELNDVLKGIEKTAIINFNSLPDEVHNMEEKMIGLTLEEAPSSPSSPSSLPTEGDSYLPTEEMTEMEDKYVDNPFGKWAFKGKSSNFYDIDGKKFKN